jgi:hypothetical protein
MEDAPFHKVDIMNTVQTWMEEPGSEVVYHVERGRPLMSLVMPKLCRH